MELLVFVLSLYPALSSSISLGGGVISMSVISVAIIASQMGSWYSLILFVVYVGALLVLFIYVCMMSSNYSMIFDFLSFLIIFMGILVSLNFLSSLLYSSFFGWEGFDSALHMFFEGGSWMFLGLAGFLFLVFLGVANIISSSGTLHMIEK